MFFGYFFVQLFRKKDSSIKNETILYLFNKWDKYG